MLKEPPVMFKLLIATATMLPWLKALFRVIVTSAGVWLPLPALCPSLLSFRKWLFVATVPSALLAGDCTTFDRAVLKKIYTWKCYIKKRSFGCVLVPQRKMPQVLDQLTSHCMLYQPKAGRCQLPVSFIFLCLKKSFNWAENLNKRIFNRSLFDFQS